MLLPASILATLVIFVSTADTSEYETEDVTFKNESVTLAGQLLLPSSPGPHPAAVVIQGSGDSDRTNRWSFLIAETLAVNGIVVLLTDKRGCGKSKGDWHLVDFNVLARDALAGVELLRKRSEVDKNQVGLVGLSQGGHIAPLAAAESSAVAFVVNVCGSAVTMEEAASHGIEQNWIQAGAPKSGVRQALDFYRRSNEYARSGTEFEGYLRQREALETAWGARAVETFPAAPDHWYWSWWRGIIDFDPIPYWERLDQPALVCFGELDEQDNVPVAESVKRLERAFAKSQHERATIRVFPGTGHALNDTDAPTFELLDEFEDLIASWIQDLEPVR